VDYRGGYAGECVSLVKRYCDEALGVPLGAFTKYDPDGTGPLTAQGSPNGEWASPQAFDLSKWEKIPVQELPGEGGYRVGDIMFFNVGGYGHVGIVTAVLEDGKKIQIMDQGWGDPGGSKKVHFRVYSAYDVVFKGVMRLK
jgi:cell wall-associated NlpC family hydrolase